MKRLDYRVVFKYFCVFSCFLLCFKAIEGVPIGLAALPAFLCEGFSFTAVFLFFIIAALINFGIGGGGALCLSAAFLCVVYYIYKKKKARAGLAGCFFEVIALIPYLAAPVFEGALSERIIYSAIIAGLSVVFTVFVRAVLFKGLKRKVDEGELAAAATCVTVLASGVISVFSQNIWECIAIFVLLCACYVYKSPHAFYFAFVLPMASCAHEFSLVPLAEFFIYCAVALLFVKRSKLLTALAHFAVAACIIALKSTTSLTAADWIFGFLPGVLFLFFPNKAFKSIRRAVGTFDETTAVREFINDERRGLAARLFSLSSAFYRLEECVAHSEGVCVSDEREMQKIAEKIVETVCDECPKRADCIRKIRPIKTDVLKILSIGASKGRVSLIDIPKEFSEYCRSLNSVIYEANKAIADYAELKNRAESVKNTRKMLCAQANCAGGVLKSLSYEFSACVCFKSEAEKNIFDALSLEGVVPDAVLSVGEEEFHLIFSDKRADFKKAAAVISRAAGKPLCLNNKIDLGSAVFCVYKKRPEFDAAFGIARKKKDGSPESGDTHSLTKINEGRFMVALCDGMGSGEFAHEGSSSAIELIEALACAGLSSEDVAGYANSLLSVCESDSFTTLDMAIIDLYAGICDFIKVGASFGLMVCAEGVKVIENEALPLGISEELKPSARVIDLRGGEIIVLMSDGITDAFFSSTEAADFLQAENCANPQSLAERLLMRAIENNGGVAADDMTVIAVKIYNNAG